ncbi:polyprotein [Phytophthora megakarya]|uniref:Polyprotein n=1 Tax=Phytophthora megakarya TaxID=4795 RepID=A0A225VA33_9STRA|nr:polyprotein [Phytophthora megakarya]
MPRTCADVNNCGHCPSQRRCSSCSAKKRPGSVGAGRPTGWNGGLGPPVATQPPSPVLHAHFNATTASCDTRLIIVSLEVAGARRQFRALLDSGASHNFLRASCLSLLPEATTVRDLPGEMIVKLADGKPHRMSRREVVLPYMFDGFQSIDTFMVIETNHAFDCILGMPWLARYQPKINWLARLATRRLRLSPSDWPHVTVVDQLSTTQSMHRASDGPLCVACSAVVHDVHMGGDHRGDAA